MKAFALSIVVALVAVGCSTSQVPLAHVDIDRVTDIAAHIVKTDKRVTAPSEGLELNNIQVDAGTGAGQEVITVIFTDPSSHKILTRDADGKPKRQSMRVVRVFINNNGMPAGVGESTETFEEPEWKNY